MVPKGQVCSFLKSLERCVLCLWECGAAPGFISEKFRLTQTALRTRAFRKGLKREDPRRFVAAHRADQTQKRKSDRHSQFVARKTALKNRSIENKNKRRAQPLWAPANLRKFNRIIPHQPQLLL